MANRNWNGSTGNWNVASNWSGGGVPGAGDTASITKAGSGPYVVTYDT